MPVPTVEPVTNTQRQAYIDCVCDTLNNWNKTDQQSVKGYAISSANLGIGIAKLESVRTSDQCIAVDETDEELLQTFDRLRKAIPTTNRALDPTRDLLVFDKNQLFIIKPVGLRYWTRSAALNDADEIAGTLLMHAQKERI